MVRVDQAEGLQEGDGPGDFQLGIENIQIQEVGVVADKVGAAPVHRTEQEGDVVFIDGIVAEVVEFDLRWRRKSRMAGGSTPRSRNLTAYSAAMSFETRRVNSPPSQRSMV